MPDADYFGIIENVYARVKMIKYSDKSEKITVSNIVHHGNRYFVKICIL
jgi:hypothetical protein